MDTQAFSQSIGDLTSALGDPTRRGIYIAVREAPEPATASQIADLFSIHPNVARHHLDRLAEDGYLEITRRRPDGKSGPGAGRPAKCYTATAKEIDLHFPARRYDLLSELLVRMIERIDPGNIGDFGAEVEMHLGDNHEKHIITFSACVHIPAGLMHCPLNIKKVSKPIMFFDITLSPGASVRPVPKASQ